MKEATQRTEDLVKKFNQFMDERAEEEVLCIIYTTEQGRGIIDYVLGKIWIMLHGSGIFMYHKVAKRGDKFRVTIELSKEDDYDPYASENDSEAESECSGCSRCDEARRASTTEDLQEDPSPVL